MYKKASISIFLALISMCIISIIMISLESARTSGLRWQANNIAHLAMDSLFSEYNTVLWKDYKIALLEYIDDKDLEDCLYRYSEKLAKMPSNYMLSNPSFEIMDKKMIVDDAGIYLEKEIVDFMKLNISRLKNMFENPEVLLEDAKKASSGSDLSEDFFDISKKAMNLEKHIKNISQDLESINKAYTKALAAIDNENISDFDKRSLDMKKDIKALNKNFEKYKKEAKKIDKQIDELFEEKKEAKLGEDVNYYTQAYEQYKLEQNERLEKLNDIVEKYNFELANIDNAREYIDEIKELEELQDENDEEDTQDYSEEISNLYSSLRDIWAGISTYNNIKLSKIDEEKKNALYNLKDLIDKGLLALVLGSDVELSKAVVSVAPLEEDYKNIKYKNDSKLDIFDKILIQEYIDEFFNSFIDNKVNLLKYEKEYIISGKDNDESNLSNTLQKLLLLRSGFNYLSLLQDRKTLQEIKVLANTIMGIAALPHLSILLESLIITVFILAESVIDIKILLNNEEVKLFKKAGEFNLSLQNLFNFEAHLNQIGNSKLTQVDNSKSNTKNTNSKKKIFNYDNYLKIIMLMQDPKKINYRILDLLEMNMKNKANNISMKNMLYCLESNMNIEAQRLFSNFVFEGDFDFEEIFNIKIKANKAY